MLELFRPLLQGVTYDHYVPPNSKEQVMKMQLYKVGVRILHGFTGVASRTSHMVIINKTGLPTN